MLFFKNRIDKKELKKRYDDLLEVFAMEYDKKVSAETKDEYKTEEERLKKAHNRSVVKLLKESDNYITIHNQAPNSSKDETNLSLALVLIKYYNIKV